MAVLGFLAGWLPIFAAEPRYFSSPEVSVTRINELLRARDWPTLAQYYDLSGTKVSRDELASGALFIRTTPPADAHPAGLWRYKQPFAPGHTFLSAARGAAMGIVIVEVELAIDQGAGPLQRTRTNFRLRQSTPGYQLIPATLPDEPPQGWAGDPAYAATGSISRTEAAGKLGIDDSTGAWHAVYSPALSTWFFSAQGAPMRALERGAATDQSLPPKAPPGFVPREWTWKPRPMPATDVIAPDELGRETEGATRMRLAPKIFSDLVPELSNERDPVLVPRETLWAVLERARERGLCLRVHVADPARPEARAVLLLLEAQ